MRRTCALLPVPVWRRGRRAFHKLLCGLVAASSAGVIVLLAIPAGFLVSLIALVWAMADKILDGLDALEKRSR